MKRKLPPAPEPPPEGYVLRRSTKTRKLEPFPMEMISDMHRQLMGRPKDPSWRDDPTYDLRKPKRRVKPYGL